MSLVPPSYDESIKHNERNGSKEMELFIAALFLVALAILAPIFGEDSRFGVERDPNTLGLIS